MSLRSFHIVFITVVTLFCIAVAVWALYIERSSQDVTFKAVGYTCALASIFLSIYAVRFYKKSVDHFNENST